ncbi:putative helicase senataxin isoform X2 [Halictus rubicundus]|uniref:putative helicase senataxin isoform X2 n=1 Tax=Halictus rubicundus TaxID=77578 RepID=UPI004035D55F
MGAQDSNCRFLLERINMPDEILLDKPDHTYTCGRAIDNEILCVGVTVSRRHCIFFRSKNELYVTDLKSVNGLFINGVAQEPYQTTQLHPNDVIGQPEIVGSNDTTLSETLLNQPNGSASCATNGTSDPKNKRKRAIDNSDVQVVPNKVRKLNQVPSCSKEESLEEHSNAADENDAEIIVVYQNGNSRSSAKAKPDALVNSSNLESSVLSDMYNSIKDKQNSVGSCKSTFQNVQKTTENNLSSTKNKENLFINTSNCDNQSENRNEDGSTRVCPRKGGKATSNASNKITVEQCPTESNQSDTSSRLRPNLINNGDTMIKMEEELQITDTEEDVVWSSTNGISIPNISPIKLKQVQQQPKTKFSEEDVVNLSDDDDDIFPCSQLFDIGFGMNTSIKQEVKEEVKEEEAEVEHEGFNMLDDEDLVISLSDSDDEDKNWLRRLSRSQTLNEDEIKIEIKDDHVTEEEPAHVSDKSADEPPSNMSEKLDAEKEMEIEKEKEKSLRHEDEDEDDDDRTANETHSSNTTGMERTEDDSVDRAISSIESSIDSTISGKKFFKQKSPNLLGSRIQENDSRPTCSTTAEPMVTPRKKSIVRKVPQIEPLHLPTRRRSSSANRTKQVPEKPPKQRQSKKEKRELEEKAKLEEYQRVKDQKNRRAQNTWANCLPLTKKTTSPLTKEEKKQLADDRKQKLKKLALESKALSLENNHEKKRIAIKPKAKVSLKTRSDLLVEDTISASKLGNVKEKPKSVNRPAVANNVLTSPKTCDGIRDREAAKEMPTRHQNSSSLTGLGRIPKKSNATEAKMNIFVEDGLEEVVLSQRIKHIDSSSKRAEVAKHKSIAPVVTASLIQNSSEKRTKKRVSFATMIKTVREYEIDESNILRKLTGKDAPMPRRTMKKVPENDMTNHFLLRIFSWSPVWLEEQQSLNSIAPVVRDDELHVMLTHYNSYDEYYRVISPLLLLETWYGITKEVQTIDRNRRRPTLMCSIVENSIQTNTPSSNLHLTTLMLEVLVTREDLQKQAYPIYGDLVSFEYISNQQKGQTFHKVFAYVNNVHETILSDWTHYNKELGQYVKRPYALITCTVLTKYLEPNILMNRVTRLRSVTYLRSNLRMVQALEYLPKSPVMNLILNPKIEQYHLPTVPIDPEQLFTRDKLNKKQLEAVFKVTETIVQKQAKLCFIQGPPGTGKSKVIVNIVSQVLYGNNRYTNSERSLKILVCAPSNAAIDEITMRLLQIRSSMQQNRFRMVRIGRSEVMHPTVKDISVTELAKRDMKRKTTSSMNIPLDSVEQEKSFLESKINALECEIASTHKMDEAYRKHLQMKIADMNVKYELLKSRKPLNEMNSKESARIQRDVENKILSCADIITCTLSSCYSKQMESLFVANKKGISVCIVDEATQSTEAETLIPLMLGVNTLVLVGDPNQLPATVLSPQAKKMGLDQSIFSRVQNAFEMNTINPIIMLDTQYRMPHDICWWPNKFFYAGKLKTDKLRNEEFPFYSYRIFHINTSQNNDNFSNTDEAQFVANMIYTMLTHANLDGWECISYGILTPYNNQKHVILMKINEKMSLLSENLRKKIKFEVNTVDGFQGQERDVIIMSCVRSQKIGFLSDRQRLCVALTRAKHSLIICGNFSVFNKDLMWNSLLSDAKSRKVYFNVNAQAEPREIKHHVVKRFSHHHKPVHL